MGNCLACFKEPNSTALDNSPNCRKEEMPEAHLYPAPSHVPASTAPPETLLSNGNHLSSLVESGSALPPPSAALVATPIGVAASSAPTSLRFYPRAKSHLSKSAAAGTLGVGIMGVGDSKHHQPSDGKLNALFDQYRDVGTEDCILAEGVERLCRDLQLDPDDFRILVLAWKLDAEQMCRFTRTEFVNGLRGMRCESVKAVQARLPEIVTEVEQDVEMFKDLYRFTFRFGLDSAAGQRILPTDMAVLLWRLVFTVREPPILGRWLRFLERHPSSVRGIPRDTWNMFLNFSEAVGDDLSCYDDNEAWPSLFDDFVEYENDQANQNISKEKDCADAMFVIEQND